MKLALTILIILFSKVIYSQDFVELPQNSLISDVRSSYSAFADIDGDGDLDLGVIGFGNGIGRVSKIYINDGNGMFFESNNTSLDPVDNGAIAFSDVDGDGDQDLLITGENNQGERIAKLYLNDSFGNFVESINANFNGVLASDVSFEDIDNDGDDDVFVVGTLIPFEGVSAKLYLNNGDGIFSESSGTAFESVRNGSIDFADVDGDGDQDILVIGENSSFIEVANLYINNGNSNFALASTPFEGVNNGSVKFADFDGDNDEDVIITGLNINFQPISKLYFNNGSGVFDEVENGSNLTPVEFSKVDVADVDNDNDIDILISGLYQNESVTILYINDGSGVFTEFSEASLMGVSSGDVSFADIDNDGDQDLLVSGAISSQTGLETKTRIYLNELVSSVTNEVEDENYFKIFPNPSFDNQLFISLEDDVTGYVNVSLYDINGKVIFNSKEYMNGSNSTIVINPINLSPNIYVLKLSSANFIFSKKVVFE